MMALLITDIKLPRSTANYVSIKQLVCNNAFTLRKISQKITTKSIINKQKKKKLDGTLDVIVEQMRLTKKITKNMPSWSNKLSEFESMQVAQVEPNSPMRACLVQFAFAFISLHAATLTMDPRKGSSNSTGKEKKNVVRTTIELKKGIIANLNNGVCVTDLAAQYNMAKPISILLRNKKRIMAADVAKGVTIVHNRQRPQIMDEVEKLLLGFFYLHKWKRIGWRQ